MALNVQNAVTPIGNANSYLSLVDARSLADAYYYALPADDTECEKALVKAFLYVETNEGQMCGERLTTTQNSSYPRKGVSIRGEVVSSSPFPNELLISQIIATESFGEGVSLSGGVDDGRSIASESLTGVGSQTFFENGKTGSSVTIPEFESQIKPLLGCGSGGLNFRVSRG